MREFRNLVRVLLLASLAAGATEARAAGPSLVDLEARIRALETQAEQLRQQAADALAAAQSARSELEAIRTQGTTPAATPAAAPAPSTGTGAAPASNANAFNPAITVILDGLYARHSRDPAGYRLAGFPLAGEAGPSPQGFSLGESEVALASNIDDKFYGQITLAFESEDGETEVGIEEAYVDTTALPHGISLRAGRFFSNIGYLNNHHAHTDPFADRPLAYQAFLGGQYGDDGVQLRWVAPSDLFLELGGELLRGDRYPAGGAAHDGVGARSLFAHAGGDVGVEHSWLAGLSLLRTDPREGEDGFSGANTLWVADLTWKWAPQGNTKDGGATFRAEYLRDERNGSVLADDASGDPLRWRGHRSGAYVESVLRLNRRWDAGYRYDRLWAARSGPYASAHDPDRHSVELTWRNSEFSLFRLQLARERPFPDTSDNSLYLQYQVALGAHGAHKF